jgi:hypothetical protein
MFNNLRIRSDLRHFLPGGGGEERGGGLSADLATKTHNYHPELACQK